MEETKKEQLMNKMIYSICDFKDEVIKSMNYIRQDMNYMRDELKGEMKELKSELQEEMKELKCELKGEINDLRNELSEYKEENNKRWEKYESNRKEDRKFLLDTLIEYDLSISKQLGDPNVEKMRKVV